METATETTFDVLLSNERYTLDDVAALFDLDVDVVCRAAQKGELPARIIDRWIIDLGRADVIHWLENRRDLHDDRAPAVDFDRGAELDSLFPPFARTTSL